MSSTVFLGVPLHDVPAVRRPPRLTVRSPVTVVTLAHGVSAADVQVAIVAAGAGPFSLVSDVETWRDARTGIAVELDVVGVHDAAYDGHSTKCRIWMRVDPSFVLDGPYQVFAWLTGATVPVAVLDMHGLTVDDVFTLSALKDNSGIDRLTGADLTATWYYYPKKDPKDSLYTTSVLLGTAILVGNKPVGGTSVYSGDVAGCEIVLEEVDGSAIADAAFVGVQDNKIKIYQDVEAVGGADACGRAVSGPGAVTKTLNLSVRAMGLAAWASVGLVSLDNPLQHGFSNGAVTLQGTVHNGKRVFIHDTEIALFSFVYDNTAVQRSGSATVQLATTTGYRLGTSGTTYTVYYRPSTNPYEVDNTLPGSQLTITENGRTFSPFDDFVFTVYTVPADATGPFPGGDYGGALKAADPYVTGTDVTVTTVSSTLSISVTALRNARFNLYIDGSGVGGVDGVSVESAWSFFTEDTDGIGSRIYTDVPGRFSTGVSKTAGDGGRVNIALSGNEIYTAISTALEAATPLWGQTTFVELMIGVFVTTLVDGRVYYKGNSPQVRVYRALETRSITRIVNATAAWVSDAAVEVEGAVITAAQCVRGGVVRAITDYGFNIASSETAPFFPKGSTKYGSIAIESQPYQIARRSPSNSFTITASAAAETQNVLADFTWYQPVTLTDVAASGAASVDGTKYLTHTTNLSSFMIDRIYIKGGYPGQNVTVAISVTKTGAYSTDGDYGKYDSHDISVLDDTDPTRYIAASPVGSGSPGVLRLGQRGNRFRTGTFDAVANGTTRYQSAMVTVSVTCDGAGSDVTDYFGRSTDSSFTWGTPINLIVFTPLVAPGDVATDGHVSTVINHPTDFVQYDNVLPFAQFVKGGIAFNKAQLTLARSGTSLYVMYAQGLVVGILPVTSRTATTVTISVTDAGSFNVSSVFTIDRYLKNGRVELVNFDATKPLLLVPQLLGTDAVAERSGLRTRATTVAGADYLDFQVTGVLFKQQTLVASITYVRDDSAVGGVSAIVTPTADTFEPDGSGVSDVTLRFPFSSIRSTLLEQTEAMQLVLGVRGGEKSVAGQWVLTKDSGTGTISRTWGASDAVVGPPNDSEFKWPIANGSAQVYLRQSSPSAARLTNAYAPTLTLQNYSGGSALPDGTVDVYDLSTAVYGLRASRVLHYSLNGVFDFAGAALGQFAVGIVPSDWSGTSVDDLRTAAVANTAVAFVGVNSSSGILFSYFVADRTSANGAVAVYYDTGSGTSGLLGTGTADGNTYSGQSFVSAIVARSAVRSTSDYKVVVLHVKGTLNTASLNITDIDNSLSYLTQKSAGVAAGEIITTVAAPATFQSGGRFVVNLTLLPTVEVEAANLLIRRDTLSSQFPDAMYLDLSTTPIQDDAGSSSLIFSLQARIAGSASGTPWYVVGQSLTPVSSSDIVRFLQTGRGFTRTVDNLPWPERITLRDTSDVRRVLPWATAQALEYRLLCQNYAAYSERSHKPMVSLGTYRVTSHRSAEHNAQYYDYHVPSSLNITRVTLVDDPAARNPITVQSSDNFEWITQAADALAHPYVTTTASTTATPTTFVNVPS